MERNLSWAPPLELEAGQVARCKELVATLREDAALVQDVRELGGLLFQLLLEPRWQQYTEARTATGALSPLRVILHIDPSQAPLAWRFPWETACHLRPNGPPDYVISSPNSSLLRLLPSDVNLPPRIPPEERLRVLVAVSAPRDLDRPDSTIEAGMPPLDAFSELRTIRGVQNCEVEDVPAEAEQLRRKLQTFRPHVLHFIAHGSFSDGQAFLIIEDASGRATRLQPEALHALFAEAGHWPALLVLHSCFGLSAPPIFSQSANNLLNDRLPVAVGFLYEADDALARVFSSSFYPLLAAGATVDTATAAARHEMRGAGPVPHFGAGEDAPAWMTPITVSITPDDGYLQLVRPAVADERHHGGGPPDSPPRPRRSPWRLAGAIVALLLGLAVIVGAVALTVGGLQRPVDMILVPAAASYAVGCYDSALLVQKANVAYTLSKQHLRPWFRNLASQGQSVEDFDLQLLAGMTQTTERLSALTARPTAIAAFYMDTCEVSRGEYAQYLAAQLAVPTPAGWKTRQCSPGEEKRPVVQVSFEEAAAFAKWKGKRLPSHGEWQYAAAGCKQQLYPWGDEPGLKKANTLVYWGALENNSPLAVDSEEVNSLGLHCMAGNVAEFCYGPDSALVACGASYNSDLIEAVTFSRQDVTLGLRDSTVGFRCARDYRPPSAVARVTVPLYLLGLLAFALSVWLFLPPKQRGTAPG